MSGGSGEEVDYIDSDELFDDEAETPTSFLDELCYRIEAFVIIFTLSFVFFLFGVVSLLVTTPGSANHVMALLNFVSTALFSIGSLAVIFVCKTRMA